MADEVVYECGVCFGRGDTPDTIVHEPEWFRCPGGKVHRLVIGRPESPGRGPLFQPEQARRPKDEGNHPPG